MPVNFEIDFIQPLLLDLQNGKFADVEDYAKAVSKYYQQTIAKGAPIGIPPTLPSPAAQGAPVPVSAGPGDGYTNPISNPSYLRMERATVGYYKAKDININKASLDFYKKSLERLVQDAKKQRDKVQAIVPLINKLTQDVAQLPQKVEEIVQGIKVVYSSYKEDLQQIINSNESIDQQEQAQITSTLESSYSEEAELAKFILDNDFNSIQQITTTSVRLQRYVKQQEQRGDSTQDIFKTRFLGLLSNIVRDLGNATQPEKFADVLVRYKKDRSNLTQDKVQIIQKAEQATESVKIIKYYVEPEIVKLKKELEVSKKNVKARFDRKIAEQKKIISKKAKEVFQKKQESEKAKLFIKYKDDVKRLKEENERKVKTYTTQAKEANSIIQESVKLAASADLIRKETLNEVDTIETKVQALEGGTSRNNVAKLNTYLSKQGLSKFRKALEPIAQNTTTDFVNIRNILQDTDAGYGRLANRIQSLEEDFKSLENSFSRLRGDNSTKRIRSSIKVKTPLSILSLLRLIELFSQKIQVLIEKCTDWIKSQIDKKRKDIEEFSERVQIAAINALPSSIVKDSVTTKKQALEEQKRVIELYKTRVESGIRKARAIALASKSSIKIAQNIAARDLRSGSNEKPLKDFSKAVFNFETANIPSNSSTYEYWANWRSEFNNSVNRFKVLDQAITLALFVLSELKPPTSSVFVNTLKEDLYKLSKTQPGLYQTDYNKVVTLIETFIKAPANDPTKLLQTIKQIDNTIKKQSLKKFIGSANVVTVLVSMERAYLQKTRKRVKQIASLNENGSDGFTKRINKLSNTLDGQGSFIVELIDLVAKESKQLESFLSKETKKRLKPLERRLKAEQEKLEEWYKERLSLLAKKKVTNDLSAQSLMYNIATNLFWVGATWVNNVGTTFQTTSIGPFKPLLIDGKVNGVEASVRELAANLQLQLLQVNGLVIPNPATGITPFPFVGYK